VSDTDSFIQEVSEEVRRDRMFRLWRRYGPFVIGAIVAVVAATAAKQWWDHRQAQAAREAGAALIEAGQAATPAARAAAFEKLAGTITNGAALLARMRAAAALAESGDAQGAAALYEAIAVDKDVDEVYAQLARLRATVLRAPEAGPEATAAALAPLAADGAPFRLLALEARAAARAQDGDAAGARDDLTVILADPAVTEGTRLRATEFLTTLGGGALASG
jgi:hypothetical protein